MQKGSILIDILVLLIYIESEILHDSSPSMKLKMGTSHEDGDFSCSEVKAFKLIMKNSQKD